MKYKITVEINLESNYRLAAKEIVLKVCEYAEKNFLSVKEAYILKTEDIEDESKD